MVLTWQLRFFMSSADDAMDGIAGSSKIQQMQLIVRQIEQQTFRSDLKIQMSLQSMQNTQQISLKMLL